MTPHTPSTSLDDAALHGACVRLGGARKRAPCARGAEHFRRAVAAGAHDALHRLEWLEPYEGKLSRTVLRGGRAGHSPPPLGSDRHRDMKLQCLLLSMDSS